MSHLQFNFTHYDFNFKYYTQTKIRGCPHGVMVKAMAAELQ